MSTERPASAPYIRLTCQESRCRCHFTQKTPHAQRHLSFCALLYLTLYFTTYLFCIYFSIYFYQLEANYFTILQWFLPYVDMKKPWIYMYSLIIDNGIKFERTWVWRPTDQSLSSTLPLCNFDQASVLNTYKSSLLTYKMRVEFSTGIFFKCPICGK